MRQSVTIPRIALALALAVRLLTAGTAEGRELLRECFDREPAAAVPENLAPGKDGKGKGWTHADPRYFVEPMPFLELPAVFDNTVRGAISFDLQRKAGDVPTGRRTVMELLDSGGRQVLMLQAAWSSAFEPRLPMFMIRGPDYYRNSLGLWGSWILLDREIAPGQWIHVDLVWDDAVGRYGLYIDGRLQNSRPRIFDEKNHAILPDSRIATNKDLAKYSLPPKYRNKPFGFFLSRVKSVRLGINSHPNRANAPARRRASAPARPGDNTVAPPSKDFVSSPLSHSVLDNFIVLVDELPPGLGISAIRSVTDDTFRIPGISGKLVSGDTASVELVALPGGKASFDMGKVKSIPMEEVPPNPGGPGIPAVDNGTYRGSYTIKPGDDYENGQIVGRFLSADNVASDPVTSASKWTIETKPQVAFSIDRKDLPADASAKARIKIVAKDANGRSLPGRRMRITLATTDEYTGTVGAGDFGKEVGATVETRWKAETDAWGEMSFDYTAGFAAKTVILTAKDLDSGGVSVDYITAFKEASIDIALFAPTSRAAARRGVAAYTLKVEASRTELTADGRSRSVIRATLLDPKGSPVEGDPVAFALSSENGTLRTIRGMTDRSGVAVAEYTAGKRIGVVVVTAVAAARNVSGSVSIVLLADAPAKIHLKARPEKLPADGFSRADLSVKVTDINDNPNRDTKVEFAVARGGGKIEYPVRTTDASGDAANRYTAGTVPGTASILATVRSKIPTEAELYRARNVLFVPWTPEGDALLVERWLKKTGEAVLRGEPIVEYTVGRGSAVHVLTAPSDGTLGEIFVEYWDAAEVGQTLATFNPAGSPYGALPVSPGPSAPRRRR